MTLRVINGGVEPDGPAPIVWNRLPIDNQRRALVIRDATPGHGGRGGGGYVDLAWDDGRPFLVGIRTVSPEREAVAVEAWKLHAELCGAVIRDERGPRLEGSTSTAEAIRQEAWKRDAARRNEPLPVGSLFDDVTRNQRALFGEP